MGKIIVYGAGTMGNGIAHSFALHQFEVIVVDLNESVLENAKKTITKNLERQAAKNIISPETVQSTLKQLTFTSDATQYLPQCDLVVEAVSEELPIKTSVLVEAEKLIPKTAILTTNTSSISITKLASHLQRPEQFIGMHFMNPVPIMQLVEVIKGVKTSTKTIKEVMATIKSLDKTPILVNDYPGFVANKILMPMINEAIYTLHEGTATVEDIDEIMRLGMAHPMGPLKLADFIGLDVCLSILRVMQEGFGNQKYAPCPLLENLVNAKMLGVKAGLGFYDWSTDKKSPLTNPYFSK
jgi:3-hydroxybutyryl-CoA dehydrogenase